MHTRGEKQNRRPGQGLENCGPRAPAGGEEWSLGVPAARLFWDPKQYYAEDLLRAWSFPQSQRRSRIIFVWVGKALVALEDGNACLPVFPFLFSTCCI